MAKGPGRPAWEPSDKDRELAANMASVGIIHEQIAAYFGIAAETLVKHLGEDLARARSKSLATVAGYLMQNCRDGNVAAQIFYLKTQGRWREQEHEPQASINITIARGADRKSKRDSGSNNTGENAP